jgi:hypothetical protein
VPQRQNVHPRITKLHEVFFREAGGVTHPPEGERLSRWLCVKVRELTEHVDHRRLAN